MAWKPLEFFKRIQSHVPVNKAGWAWIILSREGFEIWDDAKKTGQKCILWVMGKKQMNKKFFFQHFIRYSLSC